MKQREAIYNAVTSVFSDAGITFEDKMNADDLLTKELRAKVQAIIVEGFSSGKIDFADTESNRAKRADAAKLSAYVSGLISNWLRKDNRLNGDTKYVAQNPGSRIGSTDDTLKTLRALFKQYKGVDEVKAEAVKASIDERTAELRAARPSATKVDLSTLPADVLEKLTSAGITA